MEHTTRPTTARAIVKFPDHQYVSMDGVETKFVKGFFAIFGHGIAADPGADNMATACAAAAVNNIPLLQADRCEDERYV